MFTQETVPADQKLCPKCRSRVYFVEDVPRIWYGHCRQCDQLLVITGSINNSPQKAARVITVQITLAGGGSILNPLQAAQLYATIQKFEHSLRSRKILGDFHLTTTPNFAPPAAPVIGGWD